MELRQLEYFVAVAEEASFTRAAARVFITQSGVSAQIRRLEDDLGAALFDRSARRATLTAAGVAALPHARAALASVDAMTKAVDEVTGLVRGRLVVGMVVGCRVTPLFDALEAFHRDHPGIELTLTEANSDRLIELVRTGEADVALVAAAGGPPPGLPSFTVVDEGLAAAVPPGHPLARRRRIRLEELAAYPVVCVPVGTGIRTAFDEACAAAGVDPVVAFEATAPDTVVDLASRGLGVAVLAESMLAAHPDRLHLVRLDDVTVPTVLAVVWAGTPSPAVDRLVARTRAAFGIS